MGGAAVGRGGRIGNRTLLYRIDQPQSRTSIFNFARFWLLRFSPFVPLQKNNHFRVEVLWIKVGGRGADWRRIEANIPFLDASRLPKVTATFPFLRPCVLRFIVLS